MRRRSALILVALVGLTGLAGCGDDDPAVSTDETTTAPAEDPIAGRTFVATELESETATMVEGTPIRIDFGDDGTIGVETGCNQLSGTYTVEGPILVVSGLGGTEMACEPALMDQETWIATVLTERPVVTPQPPDGLELSDEGWTLTMVDAGTVDAAEPAEELVGPTWNLDTLVDGDSAGSVPEGVAATITFADDGTYAVAAGCNTGSGSYTEAGAGIYQVGAPALTRRRCDDAAMDVESAVVAVLDGEVEASIEGDRLTLTTTGEDPTALGFTAA